MRRRSYLLVVLGMSALTGCGGDKPTAPPPPEVNPTHVFDLPGGAQIEMVWINPGTFTMGAPASEAGSTEEERPQHEVTITKGFYLGKYEVTQGQWQAVMGTTPWSGHAGVQENPDNAASTILWDTIQDFIHKLNVAAGDSLYRLPTEAEWEYACRAGTTTPWSFGNDETQLGDYAWYSRNTAGERYAYKVGMKKPNPWGLYDMYGNVGEWVLDWYGPYTSSAQVDPQGPATGSHRIYRGGGFDDSAPYTRSAYRGVHLQIGLYADVGFRLVRQAM